MITADLLKNIPLFADIPDGELGTIAARAADIHLRTNDWLIQEGELPAFFISAVRPTDRVEAGRRHRARNQHVWARRLRR